MTSAGRLLIVAALTVAVPLALHSQGRFDQKLAADRQILHALNRRHHSQVTSPDSSQRGLRPDSPTTLSP